MTKVYAICNQKCFLVTYYGSLCSSSVMQLYSVYRHNDFIFGVAVFHGFFSSKYNEHRL